MKLAARPKDTSEKDAEASEDEPSSYSMPISVLAYLNVI